MPLNRDLLGREYPRSAEAYEVSREKIREFAIAIGDPNPAYTDPAAARALGHPDVIAPPTFLTTLGFRFPHPSPVTDPELGLNYALVVHGEQRFTLRRPVRAGDLLHWQQTIADIRDAGRNELLRVEGAITAPDGELVATATTVIVSRGTAASAAKEG
jgi:acyl dehydratase